MPFTALLPPTTCPAWTKAVLLLTSGFGSERKVQAVAASGAGTIQMVGGSKRPGAYSMVPYSMTRTDPGGGAPAVSQQRQSLREIAYLLFGNAAVSRSATVKPLVPPPATTKS